MKAIYCAGEQGKVVVDILRRGKDPEERVFLDDDPEIQGTRIANHEVVGDKEYLKQLDPTSDKCIVAFGDRQGVRLQLGQRVRDAGLSLFNAVDPTACLSQSATVGAGIIVNAQTYVGPDAQIDDHVLLDSLVNISHDVQLREGVIVGPGATVAGGATVRSDAYLGAGCTVLDEVTIGPGAFVGAGAVVVDDISSGETVVGVPAEPIDTSV